MTSEYPEGQEKIATAEQQYTCCEEAANIANPCETDGEGVFEACQNEKNILDKTNFNHGERKYLCNVDTCTINDVIQLEVGEVVTLDYTTVETENWTVPFDLAGQSEIHALSTANGFKILSGPDHMTGKRPFIYNNIAVTRKAKLSFIGSNEINIPNATPFKIHELVQDIGDIVITQGSKVTHAIWKKGYSEGGDPFDTYVDRDTGKRVIINGEITITPDNGDIGAVDVTNNKTDASEISYTDSYSVFDPLQPWKINEGITQIPFRNNEAEQGDIDQDVDHIEENQDECYPGLEEYGGNEFDIFTGIINKYGGLNYYGANTKLSAGNKYIDSMGKILPEKESIFISNIDNSNLRSQANENNNLIIQKYGTVYNGVSLGSFSYYFKNNGGYQKVLEGDQGMLGLNYKIIESLDRIDPLNALLSDQSNGLLQRDNLPNTVSGITDYNTHATLDSLDKVEFNEGNDGSNALYENVGRYNAIFESVKEELEAANSPLEPERVLNSAQEYGVPVSYLMAVMFNDSGYGTKGAAVRTKNPGNVGNTDSGARRYLEGREAGVDNCAQHLGERITAYYLRYGYSKMPTILSLITNTGPDGKGFYRFRIGRTNPRIITNENGVTSKDCSGVYMTDRRAYTGVPRIVNKFEGKGIDTIVPPPRINDIVSSNQSVNNIG